MRRQGEQDHANAKKKFGGVENGLDRSGKDGQLLNGPEQQEGLAVEKEDLADSSACNRSSRLDRLSCFSLYNSHRLKLRIKVEDHQYLGDNGGFLCRSRFLQAVPKGVRFSFM